MRGERELASHPSLRDLVSIVVRPRETIRRILDSGRDRWSWGVVALAAICSSYGDPDIRHVSSFLPLHSLLAIAALGLIFTAVLWVLFFYVFAWAVMFAGRWLEGNAAFADVRAAVSWGLAPLIWSIVYRVPLSVFMSRHVIDHGNDIASVGEFIRQGGCGVVVVILAIQIGVYAWITYVMSACVGEAMHFSSWKGFGAVAIPAALPVIAAIAAAIVFHT